MAPLYSSSPLVPDEETELVQQKLTADVALSTLTLIEEVLDSFQVPTSKKARKSNGKLFRKLRGLMSISLVTFTLFAGLAVAAAVLWITDLERVQNCQDDFQVEIAAQQAATIAPSSDDISLPPLSDEAVELQQLQDRVDLSLTLACRLSTGVDLKKAALWRWLLFFALWYPLGLVGQILARLVAAIVGAYALGSNAVFLTFGLHTQLGYVLRSSMWLAAWFIIMHGPMQWADEAEKWNNRAAPGDEVWNDKFSTVNFYMARALAAYLLLCICGLLRAAVSKYLSLQFHHKNHFERMQKALVQENVVQVLSKPNSLAKSTVVTALGHRVELTGMDCAHWAALKFVSHIVEGSDDIFIQLDQCDQDTLIQIKEKAMVVQLRLAEMLSNDLLNHGSNSMALDPFLSGVSPSPKPSSSLPGATSAAGTHPETSDPSSHDGRRSSYSNGNIIRNPLATYGNPTKGSLARADGSAHHNQMYNNSSTAFDGGTSATTLTFTPPPDGRTELLDPEEFVRAATTQNHDNRGDAPLAGTGQLRLNIGGDKSSQAVSARVMSMRQNVREAMQKARDSELAEQAAEAMEKLEEPQKQPRGQWLRRRKQDEQGNKTKKAQRIASRLAAAKEESTLNVHSTVNQLQSYLVVNSHIRVFALKTESEEEDDGSTIDTSMAARQLGYYVFFNMRQHDSGLAIRKHEVEEAAVTAGLRHADTAWELFDRNMDDCATLEEVMGGVQQVYYQRKSLARTLLDNQNVVAQVEMALGVTLFIAWIFITAAIFDTGAVQRTWTALSAGLLSFSFIFGGSVRELFENAIFLFFTHPFDVGDIIVFEGDRYRVKSIALQYVNIARVDGADVNVPTAEMRAARLHNMTRSDKQWDNVKIAVDIDTPRSALDIVAQHVQACIKANPKLFGGSYRVFWTEALPGHKLQFSVFFDHHDNGIDLLTVNLAKTAMHEAVANALKAADVMFTLPPVRGGQASTPEMLNVRQTIAAEGGLDTTSHHQQSSGGIGEQSRAAAAQMVLLA